MSPLLKKTKKDLINFGLFMDFKSAPVFLQLVNTYLSVTEAKEHQECELI